MTQDERLLDYLKDNNEIDPLEAWKELGIYRLSACIFRLRKQGHNIISNRKKVHNRFGENCNVARYRWGL
jgi:hypothetical protein